MKKLYRVDEVFNYTFSVLLAQLFKIYIHNNWKFNAFEGFALKIHCSVDINNWEILQMNCFDLFCFKINKEHEILIYSLWKQSEREAKLINHKNYNKTQTNNLRGSLELVAVR